MPPLPAPLVVIVSIISIIWELLLKGIALWRSAKQEQKYWFVFFVILSPINLLGIPELIYLFGFSKKKLTFDEVASWLPRTDNLKLPKKSSK